MKPLVVSVGCPSGVGPEVSLAALASLPDTTAVLVGDPSSLERLGTRFGLEARMRRVDERVRLRRGELGLYATSLSLSRAAKPGEPDAEGGAAQLAWIDAACDLVASGVGAALVTGPVSKEAIATSGARGARRFRGHTEHLAERLDAGPVVMAFAMPRGSGWFATSLVTTHLPVARAARALSSEGVAVATTRLCELFASLGVRRPRVAVTGLNPHAGEGGLLGREERDVIAPGVELAKERLARQRARVEGPLGAESAYRLAAEGAFEGVVAMLHDQATIACKLLGFGEAVNVTLGLPIVRTSVDHGTAYDLAGTGRASHEGMVSALRLAERLARRRG
ncbi:MAG: 4-hydroxythreonine-4-phosphate dehydrogenase PdxA [Deltaproteobacteria bacterium]|nr:4-hydroxythreonine-4-phosphate dehydrogenase PdxA [Deltaproteobacteria bacterium]